MAAGIVLALIALHIAVPHGLVGDGSYLAVTIGAVAVAFAGARRQAPSTPGRWAATAVAAGVACSALADLTYRIYTWLRTAGPDVSFADIPWLASYLGVAGGMLILSGRGGDGRRTDQDALINAAAAVVLSLLVVGPAAIGPALADGTASWFVRGVWASYPVLDSVLLALVLPMLLNKGFRSPGRLLLGAGAACWLVSDLGFLVTGNTASPSPWLDAGWMAGAAALGFACGSRLFVAAPAQPAPVGRVPWVGTLLVWIPLLAPGTLEIVRYAQGGEDVNPWPLGLASVVLVLLGIWRTRRILDREVRARRRLRSRERLFEALAANSSDAVFVVDATATLVLDAPALAALVGCPGSAGADFLTLLRPVDHGHAASMFSRSTARPGEVVTAEVEMRTDDGRRRWVDLRMVNLLGDPDVGGVVVNLRDITDRKGAEGELAHQAFHDVLTGLANRALFLDRVDHFLAGAARSGRHGSVLFLDLDGFKTVNDNLGHDAGDELLREVSDRLVSAVRPGDTVARLGGDEFAILIEPSTRPLDEAQVVAERILHLLSEPVTLGGHKIAVTASVGVAVAGAGASATSAGLLRDADIAMYEAKGRGKARWALFDPRMRTMADERLRLEADLLGALDRDEFRLVYQPVVDLETGCVTGFEALLRWHHPDLGIVPPDKFIPIAEENGLIVPIGNWVLHEACRRGARWQSSYPGDPALTMAVNVSGRQLASADLVPSVASALASSGLEPASLVLEMTETVLVQDVTLAAGRLAELRRSGVRLAIDDFGTGYSSLSYLRQFPVDIIKIDRSFVDLITDGQQMPTIVRGLLELARTLGLETIAEGVERVDQRDQLRHGHCASAQGYLFARPLDAVTAEALLDGDRTLGQEWSCREDGGGEDSTGGGVWPRAAGGAGVPAVRSVVS